MAPSSRSRTLSYAMPTETAPTISPSAATSGTLPRAERPRVPSSISMTSRPASASLGSVETGSPIRSALGCERRMPPRSMTTTYSAPVARRIRSAEDCTGLSAEGPERSRPAASDGSAAALCAMARARRMAWSSSCALSGARNSPVASMTTPPAMTSWVSRIWETARLGSPRRRALMEGNRMDSHGRPVPEEAESPLPGLPSHRRARFHCSLVVKWVS